MSEEIQRGPVAWEPWAAVACFVVAAVSLAVGFVLTTGWLLNAQLHPILHGVGVILLIIGIPMIILGGHCMDLQDKKVSNRNVKTIGIVVLLVLGSQVSRVQAQQTIFNVPTTDVSKTVTLAADWFTGSHAAGYFTPGIIFKVGPSMTGYTGYSIGNQNVSAGNHFFLLELGYNFN